LPHPRYVRAGQRYFPLQRSARSRATFWITSAPRGSDSCAAKREHADGREIILKLKRLLAADALSGRGRHYRFLGYKAGRSYATHAQIVGIDESWARLACPEWHPALAITVALATVPPMLRVDGDWVACRADLGATSAAALKLGRIASPDPSFPRSLSSGAGREASGIAWLCRRQQRIRERIGRAGCGRDRAVRNPRVRRAHVPNRPSASASAGGPGAVL
jgi:hypothetical protein